MPAQSPTLSDIVGDGGRVARIVLGDAGLDLADQVGADVSSLGEDAAAKTGEDRYERSSKREGGERGHDFTGVRGVAAGARQVPKQHADREQRQTGDEHASDCAGPERRRETALQAVARGFGGADVGAH